VVVIFYSNELNVRTGFRLNYTATTGSTSRPGRQVILSNTPSQNVTHPTSGHYANYELSTFVYSPNFSYNPNANVRTTFTVKGMESGHDFVFAYSLNIIGTAQPTWTLQKR